MSMLKGTLIAVGFTLASLSPSFAAEGSIDDSTAFIVDTNGRFFSGKLNAKGMGEVMKNARELPGGVTVVMSKGKLYVVDDPKGTLYQMRMDMVHGN